MPNYIREFVVRAARLSELADLGSLTPQAAKFLEASVVTGLNIFVSGGEAAADHRSATAAFVASFSAFSTAFRWSAAARSLALRSSATAASWAIFAFCSALASRFATVAAIHSSCLRCRA